MKRKSTAAWRRMARAATLPALACLAVCPGLALASPSNSAPRHYEVRVGREVLAWGNTVAATVQVADPQPSTSESWSRQAIASVVRAGVDSGDQTPYTSHGYICLPSVQTAATSFTCTLDAAGTRTSVKLTFAVRYRQTATSLGQSTTSSPGVFTVDIDVIGQPAHATTALIYNGANDPYASPSSNGTTVNATAGMYLEAPRGGLVITALDAPLTACVHTTLRNVDGETAFTGTATVAHGATLTIAVDGHPPVTVPNGHFTIPLS